MSKYKKRHERAIFSPESYVKLDARHHQQQRRQRPLADEAEAVAAAGQVEGGAARRRVLRVVDGDDVAPLQGHEGVLGAYALIALAGHAVHDVGIVDAQSVRSVAAVGAGLILSLIHI